MVRKIKSRLIDGIDRSDRSNQSGQSTVEYILLLAVVAVFFSILLRSRFMTTFFGEDGELVNRMMLSMQHSYRHGLSGFTPTPQNPVGEYTNGTHFSYFDKGQTRFFLVKGYPK